MILYQYAKNEENKTINIDDIDESNQRDIYHCINCNNPIRPRAINSNQVRAHFYHPNKDNAPKCNPESYIHKLAKTLFLEHFQEKKTLVAQWTEIQYCDNVFSDSRCTKRNKREINLTEKYPFYQLEQRDSNGYIPDLLLSNNKGEKLYIEFAHTHFSTQEKRASGIPIIEIQVQQEKDIEVILKNNIIEKSKRIEFINFKTESFQCKGDCCIEKETSSTYIPPHIAKESKPYAPPVTPEVIKIVDLFVPLKCYNCNILNYGKIATIKTMLLSNDEVLCIAILEEKDKIYKDTPFPITRREKVFGKKRNTYKHFCPKCNNFLRERNEPVKLWREGKVLEDDEKWIEH